MEAKINIVEILKDKPKGTKLYADAFGELSIEEICTEDDNGITLSDNGGTDWLFYNDGKYSWRGESILVPSKEMRDWSKFAWKRGDVLVNKYNNSHIIFDKFNDDTYTTFTGKLFYQVVKAGYNYTHTCSDVMTQNFDIEKGDAAQTYINTIEEKLGGKLNMETLEIEKAQLEFKDGDIVVTDAIPSLLYSKCILILKGNFNTGESRAISYIFYNINNNHISFDVLDTTITDRNIHLATEEEKKQLFKALANEGKAWDADKKMIVDLKPKIELKPFDKVLVRDHNTREWEAELFGFKSDTGRYHGVGGTWNQCIPYIGNESLLGTTKDVEE